MEIATVQLWEYRKLVVLPPVTTVDHALPVTPGATCPTCHQTNTATTAAAVLTQIHFCFDCGKTFTVKRLWPHGEPPRAF